MIIKPRIRGFICVTAHPVGCKVNVENQIQYVTGQEKIIPLVGPKKVLIIGASTGYGLASRIVAAFGYGADTIGVFFERSSEKNKSATAGWYNVAAFEQFATKKNLYTKSINGDAYSDAVKKKTIEIIKKDLGKVDLVIYSLASSRRIDPKTGKIFYSSIKPIGKRLVTRALNTDKETINTISIEPASQDEINNTVSVMGGEDWQIWIDALLKSDALAKSAKTTAFTYLGEKITHDIYWNGSIGEAKKDLDKTVLKLRDTLSNYINGDARLSVLKAVVTQASSAIPFMPLYLSLLFKVMKEKGIHEGCIEQIYGLFKHSLYNSTPILDDMGRLRADYNELLPEVQNKILDLWPNVTTDNLNNLTDFLGYKKDFLRLFGFSVDGIDYAIDVNPNVKIKNLVHV